MFMKRFFFFLKNLLQVWFIMLFKKNPAIYKKNPISCESESSFSLLP
jgi:hypothetical protein